MSLLPTVENGQSRLRLIAVGMVAASLAVLAVVGWLHGELSGVQATSGAVAAAQAQTALWGISALTVGALGLSLHALRKYYSLKDRALYDHLTKSANRHYFQEMLHRQVRRARDDRTPLALLMIDIDFFKHYNDTNGHLMGDRALQEFSALMKNSLRSEDVLGRYGGEEFAILLPATLGADALAAARRLCGIVRSHAFERGELQPNKRLTMSVGIATLEDGMTPVDLIRRADEALYHAKRTGRDSAVLWDVRDKFTVGMAAPSQLPLSLPHSNRRDIDRRA